MTAFSTVAQGFPELAAMVVVVPNVVVDGLMRESGALPGPQKHLDLLGTVALVEELEDSRFQVSSDLARPVFAAEECPAMGDVWVVLSAGEGVAAKLAAHGAGRALKSTGHLADGQSSIEHGSDADTVCLAEVSLVDYWFGCLCCD